MHRLTSAPRSTLPRPRYGGSIDRIGELYGSVRAFRDVGHTGTPIPEHIRLQVAENLAVLRRELIRMSLRMSVMSVGRLIEKTKDTLVVDQELLFFDRRIALSS